MNVRRGAGLDRARLKSCSGVGAQWVVALPIGPKTAFTDDEFRLCTRFRIGSQTNSLEVCPHVSAEGVQCSATCDSLGYHLQQCPSGGGYFVGHDTVCAEIADLAGGTDGIAGIILDWKAQLEAYVCPRCLEKQAPENYSVPDVCGLPLYRVSLGPLPSWDTNT